jgi:hypothetical protein
LIKKSEGILTTELDVVGIKPSNPGLEVGDGTLVWSSPGCLGHHHSFPKNCDRFMLTKGLPMLTCLTCADSPRTRSETAGTLGSEGPFAMREQMSFPPELHISRIEVDLLAGKAHSAQGWSVRVRSGACLKLAERTVESE